MLSIERGIESGPYYVHQMMTSATRTQKTNIKKEIEVGVLRGLIHCHFLFREIETSHHIIIQEDIYYMTSILNYSL